MKRFLEHIYDLTAFALRFFKEVFRPPYEFGEFAGHLENFGSRSFPLVSVIGLLMGLILALQTKPTLARFGAESFLPAMVAISVIRELGPVITALVVAGRVASGIGAEIGSMRVTEQVDALEVSSVDPYRFLVVPRVLAGVIALPLLTAYADLLGIMGAFAVMFVSGGMGWQLFMTSTITSLSIADIIPGIAKTFFFGFIISTVGSYFGFKASGGTEGVGKAATSAVVFASFLILITDFVLVKVGILLFE
ncbi:MAG TPA: ABC transporter permease [Candidatus Kryptobacter bacterium]|nr:MAG: ABC transporter permease [Ignavibacteriae bacterium 37-53-5]HQT92027.1 ABC transporter permease [Candidatus Kryptobacter bacterium]